MKKPLAEMLTRLDSTKNEEESQAGERHQLLHPPSSLKTVHFSRRSSSADFLRDHSLRERYEQSAHRVLSFRQTARSVATDAW